MGDAATTSCDKSDEVRACMCTAVAVLNRLPATLRRPTAACACTRLLSPCLANFQHAYQARHGTADGSGSIPGLTVRVAAGTPGSLDATARWHRAGCWTQHACASPLRSYHRLRVVQRWYQSSFKPMSTVRAQISHSGSVFWATGKSLPSHPTPHAPSG